MNYPLLTLAIFVAWTMIILMSMFIARTRHLTNGGSYADFGKQDSALLIYRFSRAHINCIENLPLFIGAVVIIQLREVASIFIDALCVAYIVFRIAHSLIHIMNINPILRFACLLGQIVCLSGLLAFGIAG